MRIIVEEIRIGGGEYGVVMFIEVGMTGKEGGGKVGAFHDDDEGVEGVASTIKVRT